jgi:hypothetical protein
VGQCSLVDQWILTNYAPEPFIYQMIAIYAKVSSFSLYENYGFFLKEKLFIGVIYNFDFVKSYYYQSLILI